ncbi:MAG: ferredoxin-type protein NapF [Gammaproteobacteria bacterium]
MSSSIRCPEIIRRHARTESIRPPWSLPEELFKTLCSGCGACREECPRGLLQKGAGGLPFIDFALGACNLCGECVDACARGAITRRYQGVSWGPWQIQASLTGECLEARGVACRRCVDDCSTQAIQPAAGGPPSIDGQRCNGCGACYASCPAEAIALFDPRAV